MKIFNNSERKKSKFEKFAFVNCLILYKLMTTKYCINNNERIIFHN